MTVPETSHLANKAASLEIGGGGYTPVSERTKNKYNFIGVRLGRLLIIKCLGRGKHKRTYWEAICDCGNKTSIETSYIIGKRKVSCGCFGKEQIAIMNTVHGQSKKNKNTVEYLTWERMTERCRNKNGKDYKNYGGRGIKVCQRWLGKDGFINFFKDIGKRPSNNHSLDRINVNGNYCKDNCRWATQKEQSRNRRNNVWIEYKGKKMIFADWAKYLGCTPPDIRYHLKSGRSFNFIVNRFYNEKK